MEFSNVFNSFGRSLRKHSPVIFAAAGIAGTLATAYFVGRATYLATQDIAEADPEPETTPEKVKLVWKRYIPAGVTGALAIGSIIASVRVGGRRTAAAVAAYSLTERAFATYKDKVLEQMGEKKEQAVRDQIAQEYIRDNPPDRSNEVIVQVGGDALFCELYTKRYFHSDMETIRRAQNDLNAELNSHMWASLSEFYNLIGLPHTSQSDRVGWDSDRLMELRFSPVISENDKPCIAFDYNYVKPL